MTYWAINAVFLAVVAVIGVVALVFVRRGRRGGMPARAVGLAMVIVLLMTAVFDNVMIGVGLVGYDESKISGQFVGSAPLEDFAYAVAAVILLPSLWVLLGPRLTRGSGSSQPRAGSTSEPPG